VLAAVKLAEVERVAVAGQKRQLHMLAIAAGVSDAVKNHIAFLEIQIVEMNWPANRFSFRFSV
jgi:hypothetical protein